MQPERLRASWILRLTQRLSRLSFELRNLRTGESRHFDSADALSGFLEAAAAAGHHEIRPAGNAVGQAWNDPGTSARHRADQVETR